jgi:hypothetical protein
MLWAAAILRERGREQTGQARNLGVPVLSEEEFLDLLGGTEQP